tara:strand:- start:47 stop:385 length:339 start_codon:yes stop_codon:yes gene_type:complete
MTAADDEITSIANMEITKGILNYEKYEITSGQVKIVLPCGTEIQVICSTKDSDGGIITSDVELIHPSDKFRVKVFGKDGHTMKVSKRTKQTTYKYGTYTAADISFKTEKKEV